MKIYSDIFKLKHNGISPKQGSILISEPFAPDAIFSRAVILLAEHNKNGSVGFILNKPLNKTISQLSSEFGKNDMKVSIGGPVENNKIYYIHTYGNKIPNSMKITNGLYWGGDF
ncbi:MAG: YqgE/AlgH family protein, partial [Chlorobi bacterium]|nr:YqgE/AlgH family protein [Chlorobiota bacterium]